MSDGLALPRPVASPETFRIRAGLALCVVVMGLVIWASHAYFTRTFSEEQETEAQVRATLYAGSIQSAMQRHLVVPLLLSRDPILMNALASGVYGEAEMRLASFREEIGAGSIFLLDAGGEIVAASDARPLDQYDKNKGYFTAATTADGGTQFSLVESENGTYSFHFARKVEVEGRLLGVIVVTVDLAQQEEGWQRTQYRVVVTDSEGLILLSSEPAWRQQTLSAVLGLDADLEANMPAASSTEPPASLFATIGGTRFLRAEVPMGFRSWRLTYFATLEDVRARVNAVLALIIMVMALLLALGFYQVSRRTQAESRKLQTESEELRVLNRRLSAEIGARQRVERNLKDAEQSLEQASKLAALGQMSAAVSHELNQPLAAMKTYLAGARLLLQRRRPDEALSSFQRIDDLIERMGGITRQLKSYARKGDVDYEAIDLRKSVRAALSMMAPQLGRMAVDIATTLPSEPVIVEADPLRIEQIIVNLLRNALDAVKALEDRHIKIFLVQGETILLSIEDNGAGLKDAEKLFEPFYTTKKPGEGLGLGLAISAGFAAELGGRLVARNAPDGGAVFELQLPRHRLQTQAAE